MSVACFPPNNTLKALQPQPGLQWTVIKTYREEFCWFTRARVGLDANTQGGAKNAMLTVFLLSSAALLTTPHRLRPCSPTASASARHGGPRAALDPLDDPLERLSAALPYLGEELLAEDVRYSGLGVTLQGRDAYAAATAAWSRVLPQRLGLLKCERKTVLPPDSRRRVTARYSLEFEAPVPPQVLPAQRARLLSAGVPTSGRPTLTLTLTLTQPRGRPTLTLT